MIKKEIKILEKERKNYSEKVFVQKWYKIIQNNKKCKCCGGQQ